MARDGIKGYHVLLTSNKKIAADGTEKAQEKKFLNLSYSTSHLKTRLPLAQEYTVRFQILKKRVQNQIST